MPLLAQDQEYTKIKNLLTHHLSTEVPLERISLDWEKLQNNIGMPLDLAEDSPPAFSPSDVSSQPSSSSAQTSSNWEKMAEWLKSPVEGHGNTTIQEAIIAGLTYAITKAQSIPLGEEEKLAVIHILWLIHLNISYQVEQKKPELHRAIAEYFENTHVDPSLLEIFCPTEKMAELFGLIKPTNGYARDEAVTLLETLRSEIIEEMARSANELGTPNEDIVSNVVLAEERIELIDFPRQKAQLLINNILKTLKSSSGFWLSEELWYIIQWNKPTEMDIKNAPTRIQSFDFNTRDRMLTLEISGRTKIIHLQRAFRTVLECLGFKKGNDKSLSLINELVKSISYNNDYLTALGQLQDDLAKQQAMAMAMTGYAQNRYKGSMNDLKASSASSSTLSSTTSPSVDGIASVIAASDSAISSTTSPSVDGTSLVNADPNKHSLQVPPQNLKSPSGTRPRSYSETPTPSPLATPKATPQPRRYSPAAAAGAESTLVLFSQKARDKKTQAAITASSQSLAESASVNAAPNTSSLQPFSVTRNSFYGSRSRSHSDTPTPSSRLAIQAASPQPRRHSPAAAGAKISSKEILSKRLPTTPKSSINAAPNASLLQAPFHTSDSSSTTHLTSKSEPQRDSPEAASQAVLAGLLSPTKHKGGGTAVFSVQTPTHTAMAPTRSLNAQEDKEKELDLSPSSPISP